MNGKWSILGHVAIGACGEVGNTYEADGTQRGIFSGGSMPSIKAMRRKKRQIT